MKITIEEQDRVRAMEEFTKSQKPVGRYCLIFQALRRHGIPVVTCGVGSFVMMPNPEEEERIKLPQEVHSIATFNPVDWPTVKLPFEFEIEVEP